MYGKLWVKKMRKYFILAVFAALLLFSFGCIKIKMYQNIYADGSADAEVKMDLSVLPEEYMEELDEEEFCDEVESSAMSQYTGENCEIISCELEGEEVSVKSHCEDIEEGGVEFTVEPGIFETTYTYSIELDDSSYESPYADLVDASQMKAMGFEMMYYINMPGSIVSTSYGEIEDNTVEIDLIEYLADESKDDIIIVSKETNVLLYIIIGLLILGIIFLLMHRTRESY